MASLKRPILFDLDGTLVDSLPILFRVYRELLESHGAVGTPEEFHRLNGPPFSEIVPYLKRAHGLAGSEEEIAADCAARIARAYRTEITLRPGARDLLHGLAERGHRLALVTSGLRAVSAPFVEAHGLSRLFDAVVFGDDVRVGKPSPEPYLHAMRRLGLSRPDAVAVEDSPTGVRAARAAGAFTVGLSRRAAPAAALREAGADRIVIELAEIPDLEILRGRRGLVLARGDVAVRESERSWSPRDPDRVAERFRDDARVKSGEVFDAPLAVLDRFDADGGTVRVACRFVPYRYYYTQRLGLDWEQGIRPVGVSGVTVARDGGEERVLFARRSDRVTSYPGALELVPSGSIDHAARAPDGRLDPTKKIREEFVEETGLPEDIIRHVEPVALLYDPSDACYDIGCRIDLEPPYADLVGRVENNAEYRDPTWVRRGELAAFVAGAGDHLVPTSRALVRVLLG